MSKKLLTRMIGSVVGNEDGLGLNIFRGFFLSDKSVDLQSQGVISFLVHSYVNKTLVKKVIDRISGEKNCVSVRVVNLKPRWHDSRVKRGQGYKKLKGKTVGTNVKKIYAQVRDPSLVLAKLGEINVTTSN